VDAEAAEALLLLPFAGADVAAPREA
jgi:hypothetical protein